MEILTIVMFSGGIDSTGALYKLLTQTDNLVSAHHIAFINRENRHNVEEHSCRQIVEWLRNNVRHFDYTESVFYFPFPHIGWDIINAMYVGGIVAKNYVAPNRQVQLCVADTKDDFKPSPSHGKSMVAHLMGLAAALEPPQVEMQASVPTIVNPVVKMSKSEVIQMLPKELLDLTWSCRTPIVNDDWVSTCGTCVTCKTLKEMGNYTDRSLQVVEYFRMKR